MTKQISHAGKPIRCILFDFGDTLWTRNEDTHQLAEQFARVRAAEVVRRHLDLERFPFIDTEEFPSLLQTYIGRETRLRMRQKVGYEPDFADATISALVELGLPRLDYAIGAEIFEALRVRIPESRRVFPDTYATLTALQERGYLLGVVTNRGYGGELFRKDMRQISFDRYFDLSAMAVSADLGIRKPNPDMFLYALDKLGAAPDEAAMVGDSLHADIQGANLLDIFSIWRPKKRLHQELLAATRAQSSSVSIAHATQNSAADLLQENDDDAVLDKQALFTYVQQNQQHEYQMPGGDARPDHIIYTLSELLEIF